MSTESQVSPTNIGLDIVSTLNTSLYLRGEHPSQRTHRVHNTPAAIDYNLDAVFNPKGELIPNLSQEPLTPKQRIDAGVVAQAIAAISSERQTAEPASLEQMMKELNKIHNVTYEIEVLQKMKEKNLPEAYRKMYINDQLVNMATEHAMGIPYNTLKIVKRPDGRWEMYGMDVLEMYESTALLPEAGQREKAEYIGIRKQNEYLNSGKEGALQWSSRYIAERGFGYFTQKAGYDPEIGAEIIEEHIIRYEPGDLESTQKFHQASQKLAGERVNRIDEIQNRLDMVANPVPFQQQIDVNELLKIVGVSQEDVAYSRNAKEVLKHVGEPLIQAYFSTVDWLAMNQKNISQLEFDAKLHQAQLDLALFYKTASDIKNILKGEKHQINYALDTLTDSVHKIIDNGNGMKAKYDQITQLLRQNTDQLRIIGGSDCAVTGKGSSISAALAGLVMDNIPVNQGLQQLITQAEKNQKKVEFMGDRKVTCPGKDGQKCGTVVTISERNLSEGKLQCPNCGLELKNKCDVEAVYEAVGKRK
jgi:hypothetical protein